MGHDMEEEETIAEHVSITQLFYCFPKDFFLNLSTLHCKHLYISRFRIDKSIWCISECKATWFHL